jgi:hypothetical protein
MLTYTNTILPTNSVHYIVISHVRGSTHMIYYMLMLPYRKVLERPAYKLSYRSPDNLLLREVNCLCNFWSYYIVFVQPLKLSISSDNSASELYCSIRCRMCSIKTLLYYSYKPHLYMVHPVITNKILVTKWNKWRYLIKEILHVMWRKYHYQKPG